MKRVYGVSGSYGRGDEARVGVAVVIAESALQAVSLVEESRDITWAGEWKVAEIRDLLPSPESKAVVAFIEEFGA